VNIYSREYFAGELYYCDIIFMSCDVGFGTIRSCYVRRDDGAPPRHYHESPTSGNKTIEKIGEWWAHSESAVDGRQTARNRFHVTGGGGGWVATSNPYTGLTDFQYSSSSY
jgi:hypothetical protein